MNFSLHQCMLYPNILQSKKAVEIAFLSVATTLKNPEFLLLNGMPYHGIRPSSETIGN